MKRLVALIFASLLGLMSGMSRAEEPYLDFVHGLRRNGLPEYALQYLDELSKNAPPALASELPLERAMARADMAAREPELNRRDALYTEAREEFAAFVKQKPSTLQAAEASVELARMVYRQGKLQQIKADQQETAEGRKADLARAKTAFDDAAKKFQEASGLLAKQLARKDLPDADRAGVSGLSRQLELEHGINLLELFLSFDDSDTKDRPKIAKQALDTLKKVAGGDIKDPLTWTARAWVGRYYYEIQDYRSSSTELNKIVKEKDAPAAGKRLARYFLLMVQDKLADAKKDPLPAKIKAADEWLRDYADFNRTTEGYGVRYQLGDALMESALKRPKGAQYTAETQQLFARAERQFEIVEKAENEYSRRAHRHRLRSIITRSGERSRGDISKLKDFQECYLRAQLEIWQMQEEENAPPPPPPAPANTKPSATQNTVAKTAPVNPKAADDPKKKRAKHIADTVVALNRALEFADDKTPSHDLNDARLMLAYLYLHERDDPYRAAILGEHIAKSEPQFRRASAAAGFALQAYYQILIDDQGKEASPAILNADRVRLTELAGYMEKTWPHDPATGLARHQLGSLALRDKKYVEAIQNLVAISPSYGAYTMSQCQLATAALQAEKDKVPIPKGQPSFRQQALAALQKIPDLAPSAEPAIARYYFMGRIELAQLLFAERKFDAMAALATQVGKRFAETKAKLPDDLRKEVEAWVKPLPAYAILGQAEMHYRAGKIEDTRKLIDPLVDALRKDNPYELKDPGVLRRIMGLALQAAVLDADTKRAQDILNTLLAKKSDSELEDTSAILADLVRQLRSNVEDLRKKGKEGEKELEKTVSSFASFLNEVAKGIANEPPEKVLPDLYRFLALGYSSLDKHRESAELLAKIPPPKPDKDKPEVDPEKQGFYRGLQMMLVREYRQGKEFDKARSKLRELLLTDWGKKTPELQKELNWLYEDEGKYLQAAGGWNKLMSTLRPALEKYPAYKDLYFDCYYHFTFCVFKASQTGTDKGKQREYFHRAATLIAELRKNRPDMGGDTLKKQYDTLLEREPGLRREVESLEKSR